MIKLLTALLLLFVLLSSCSSIRKMRSNVKESISEKSSDQVTKKTDSTFSTVTKTIDSTGTTVTVEFETDSSNTDTHVEIVTYHPHKDDYDQGVRTEVKTNRKPKNIKVQQSKTNDKVVGTAVSVKKEDTKDATRSKETKTEIKQVDKKKFVFHWWWILIAIAVLFLWLWFKHKIIPAGAMVWVKNKFTKTHNMKNLILLFTLSAMLMIGCDAPKENKVEERQSLMRPDVDLDWELGTKDTTGDYAVIKPVNGKGQWVTIKDTTWQKQIKIPRSIFWITMSKKMVREFMVLSNYFTGPVILTIVLAAIVALFCYFFFKFDWTRKLGSGKFAGVIFAVLLIIPFRIAQKRPTELAGNNVAKLSRAEYEYWKAKDSTFRTFWLQKWENNELTGLRNKKVIK